MSSFPVSSLQFYNMYMIMKCVRILLTLVVFTLLFSCKKPDAPQQPSHDDSLASHEDSLVELMSKLTGVYQVNVTTESSHAGYPTVYDTLGLETFTVSKVNQGLDSNSGLYSSDAGRTTIGFNRNLFY